MGRQGRDPHRLAGLTRRCNSAGSGLHDPVHPLLLVETTGTTGKARQLATRSLIAAVGPRHIVDPCQCGVNEGNHNLAQTGMSGCGMSLRDRLLWAGVILLGTVSFGVVALTRGEAVNAAWLVVAAVCIYFIAYRFYALFVARAGSSGSTRSA
jgi:hypothetical protein